MTISKAEYLRRRALREALAVALAPVIYADAPCRPSPHAEHNSIAAKVQDCADAIVRMLFAMDETEREVL